MTNHNRAAIYCRLSKEDAEKNGESESIQNQKALLLDYACQRGWFVCAIYCDEDYSGMDRQRPGFCRLIRDAEKRLFDIVLVKTQSRFTRDMELVEKYLHGKFPLWGIRFVAVVDNADTLVRGNKKARQINGLINEWYLEDLSENIRAVFDIKRRNGQFIGSFPVYGYRKAPNNHNQLVIDPEAAGVVREIFALYLAGLGKQRIAQVLNQRQIPNPTKYKQLQGFAYQNGGLLRQEGLWNRTSVGRILKNSVYTGELVQGVRRKCGYKSKKLASVPKDQWIVVKGTHEPIVDRDTFEQAGRLLQERTKTNGRGEVHPLAGKVFCLNCRETMIKYSCSYQGVRHSYLRCKGYGLGICTSHSIRLDLVEAEVSQRIRAYIQKYYDIHAAEKRLNSCCGFKGEDPGRVREVRRLQREIERREKAAHDLYLDKVSGLIGNEQFQELNQAYLAEKTTLTAQLTEFQRQEKALFQMYDVAKLLDFNSLPRGLAALCLSRVEIGERDPLSRRQEIHIFWNF